MSTAVSTSKVPARHRSLLTLAGTHHTHPTMSATACPIAIKVHVHSGYCRSKLPPVAARLQAREKPERKAVSDEVRDAFGFFLEARECLTGARRPRRAFTRRSRPSSMDSMSSLHNRPREWVLRTSRGPDTAKLRTRTSRQAHAIV